MARTHTFKGSASAGYGYFAYIEDGQLVIGEDWGREGGILYKGPFACKDADKYLAMLRKNSPKLCENILRYYANVDAKEKSNAKYHFKDSRDSYGNGYSGYLDENYDLVLVYNVSCYHDVYYRGPYATAGHQLGELRSRDQVLYDDIDKYFTKHGVKDESDRKDLGGSKETKYTVRLLLNNGKEIVAVIPGTSETDVIRKIMLPVPDTVMMYDLEGRTMAVRSDKIYTVAILD